MCISPLHAPVYINLCMTQNTRLGGGAMLRKQAKADHPNHVSHNQQGAGAFLQTQVVWSKGVSVKAFLNACVYM